MLLSNMADCLNLPGMSYTSKTLKSTQMGDDKGTLTCHLGSLTFSREELPHADWESANSPQSQLYSAATPLALLSFTSNRESADLAHSPPAPSSKRSIPISSTPASAARSKADSPAHRYSCGIQTLGCFLPSTRAATRDVSRPHGGNKQGPGSGAQRTPVMTRARKGRGASSCRVASRMGLLRPFHGRGDSRRAGGELAGSFALKTG